MNHRFTIRWQLVLYDNIILCSVVLFLLVFSGTEILPLSVAAQLVLTAVCVFCSRAYTHVYGQIWRYGGIQSYIRLLFADSAAFLPCFLLNRILPIQVFAFSRLLAVACLNLLGCLSMRMMYRYAYKCGDETNPRGRFLLFLLRLFAGKDIVGERNSSSSKIKIAIVGAGRVGVSLAEELHDNPSVSYLARCFVDVSAEKVGRNINGIPVLMEEEATMDQLRHMGIQEVVFAIPDLEDGKKKTLYNFYRDAGYKIKVYDFPVMQSAGGKRRLRDFDIEELLFRKPIVIDDRRTRDYYKDKVVLITGGGGSIGSELCRQLAKLSPKQIIILDIYENGAYDVQQELLLAYQGRVDIRIEILSITNFRGMERIFAAYRPNIVINAAAHKHVPLMEHNCIEAVENNVFGTRNLIVLCEQFETERFMMVSTDKAVNPTNVMGATKRMCEMMVQSASTCGKTKYSATRFGNVLGSAGSVIPLFKRQIINGGPITITDKRIIRYFMTISEASQLVLASGAMAHNGELFVLDMGQPIRILDLAENMIRLSGVQGIQIIETGLRPGEKLYEELLVKTEELDKTENSLIFIERDTPLPVEELKRRYRLLELACESGEEKRVRAALHQVIPTFHRPEEVNAVAEDTEEMQNRRDLTAV